MQVKFCLHSCKNFCSVLVVLPVWMCFSVLRPRSLINFYLVGHMILSKTFVNLFLHKLTSDCYFLAVRNLPCFAQFFLLLQFVVFDHITVCFVLAFCYGFSSKCQMNSFCLVCVFPNVFAVCTLFFFTCIFEAYFARLFSGTNFACVAAFCAFLLLLFLLLFGLGHASIRLCVLCASVVSVPILHIEHTHTIFICCMRTCTCISYSYTCPFVCLHICTTLFTHKHSYPCPVTPYTSS